MYLSLDNFCSKKNDGSVTVDNINFLSEKLRNFIKFNNYNNFKFIKVYHDFPRTYIIYQSEINLNYYLIVNVRVNGYSKYEIISERISNDGNCINFKNLPSSVKYNNGNLIICYSNINGFHRLDGPAYIDTRRNLEHYYIDNNFVKKEDFYNDLRVIICKTEKTY